MYIALFHDLFLCGHRFFHRLWDGKNAANIFVGNMNGMHDQLPGKKTSTLRVVSKVYFALLWGRFTLWLLSFLRWVVQPSIGFCWSNWVALWWKKTVFFAPPKGGRSLHPCCKEWEKGPIDATWINPWKPILTVVIRLISHFGEIQTMHFPHLFLSSLPWIVPCLGLCRIMTTWINWYLQGKQKFTHISLLW